MTTLVAANKEIWRYIKSKWVIICVLVLMALMLHVIFFQFTSADLELFLFDWFEYYDQVPIAEALQNPISNYTGPYTYLLLIAKLAQKGIENLSGVRIPAIAMIKLIDIPFELLTVYFGMMILWFYKKEERILFLGLSFLLLHPIILINGSFWGQCDIIYTSMLLAAFMFILYEKDVLGVLFFAIALTFKFQAMFFAPMILALIFANRIRWYWLGVVPAVYLILHLPSLVAGRPIWDVITIYLNQAGSMPVLAGNAPNLYAFFPELPSGVISTIRIIGLVLTVIVALWFALKSSKVIQYSKLENMILLVCLTLILMPSIMPSMLDRYFFPAEIFLLLLALVNLKLWFLPVMVTTASILVYYNSYNVINLGVNALPAKIAGIINTIVLIILLIKFLQLNKEPDQNGQVPE